VKLTPKKVLINQGLKSGRAFSHFNLQKSAYKSSTYTLTPTCARSTHAWEFLAVCSTVLYMSNVSYTTLFYLLIYIYKSKRVNAHKPLIYKHFLSLQWVTLNICTPFLWTHFARGASSKARGASISSFYGAVFSLSPTKLWVY